MIRLIVEDGGDRRGFKVGDGVLTVGSGQEAKLQLDAPDVAAIHADLEVQGGVVTLRPRPGVRPPEVGGAPVDGPVELYHDTPVVIGGARVTAHYPEGSKMRNLPPAPADQAAPPVRKSAAAPVAARRSPGGSRSVSQRSRNRSRKNKGALMSLGLFGGAVALVAGFVFFIGPKFMGQTAAEFEPAAHMGAARRLLTRGDFKGAVAQLDSIPAETLTGPVAAQVQALRAEIKERMAGLDLNVHNTFGNAWWRENLDRYEKFHLRGTPEPGAIRLFLERLDYFASEWPEHPELDWVRRMQERYAGLASLDEPPAPTDLAFKVHLLTAESDPKDWAGAFAAIDEFVRTTTGSDRNVAVDLRAEIQGARQEWFDDKIQQARSEYDQGDAAGKGRSFAWLVRIVVYAGDGEMAEQAATQLVRFEGDEDLDLGGALRGYRTQKPAEFAVLAEHPRIAAYLRANPLD